MNSSFNFGSLPSNMPTTFLDTIGFLTIPEIVKLPVIDLADTNCFSIAPSVSCNHKWIDCTLSEFAS